MKQYGASGTPERKAGQWTHLMQNFECAEADSTMTTSFEFVYCIEGSSKLRHWSSLWITGDGGTDEYWLYTDPTEGDERLPADAVAAGIDGAYHITADSNTALLSACDPNNGSPINVIPVSHDVEVGALSTAFQVQFRNRLIEEEGWFMINDISIMCSTTSSSMRTAGDS